MVNTLDIKPPTAENPSDQDRAIDNGPLHDLSMVQDTVRQSGSIYLLTQDCQNDVYVKLAWSAEDIAQLVLSLEERNYRNSEWCKSNLKWLACDAYVIQRVEERRPNSMLNCEYYLKFTLGPTGKALLFVSCHLST